MPAICFSISIIFASTSSVYGEIPLEDFPVNETYSLNPISPYGKSKKLAEEFCIQYAMKKSFNLSILRFYTVYGPRQRPDEAFTKFIRLILNKKPIPIYGDGKKERDFTYVSDIVRGAVLAAMGNSGIFNLGTNNPITVNDMILAIEKFIEIPVKKEYIKSPPGDVQKTHADISKAKIELNYSPSTSFEQGIQNCISWCKETQMLFSNS